MTLVPPSLNSEESYNARATSAADGKAQARLPVCEAKREPPAQRRVAQPVLTIPPRFALTPPRRTNSPPRGGPMRQGQGSDAWIAYADADAEWVDALARRLGDASLTVFYDEFGRSAIIPGSARVNIVVVSPSSASQARGSIAHEALARLSTSGGRPLVVVNGEVEAFDLPAEPTIRFPGGEVGDERAFQLLLTFIRLPATVSNLPGEPSGVPIRTEELDALLGFFQAPNLGIRIAAIVGATGLGKTSLARYLAHRLRDRFPDGQLFCAVGRRSPLPRALRLILDELGLPRSELFELPDQIEAYRVLTAGRRMLLVLDAVSDSSELADLVPTTPGSAVL